MKINISAHFQDKLEELKKRSVGCREIDLDAFLLYLVELGALELDRINKRVKEAGNVR